MKTHILAAFAGVVLGGGTAIAADLPVKAPRAPAPVAVANWSGCYVAAGGGFGMFKQNRHIVAETDTVLNVPGIIVVADAGGGIGNESFGGHGWLATAQFGCDYQFGSNWVIGAFIDGDKSRIRGDQDFVSGIRGEAELRWSWAVGGRVGWLVTPTLLAYVAGGYTEAKFRAVNFFADGEVTFVREDPDFIVVAPGGPTGLQLAAQKYRGFFIGGGAEYALGWWPGLFWKTEYRFADYRRRATPFICAACTPAVPIGIAAHTKTYVQTVRTELVWRFNWGGPVVARN
jgi:outer membrane immunogenic protein